MQFNTTEKITTRVHPNGYHRASYQNKIVMAKIIDEVTMLALSNSKKFREDSTWQPSDFKEDWIQKEILVEDLTFFN